MTIAEALKTYNDIEADLLLGHVLNKPREFLYIHSDKKLTSLQLKKLQRLAEQRRKGMPAAYLLGYKYFYGLKFKVNKDVLIPRPETEWLVDKTLTIIDAKKVKDKAKSIKILDMGTGSGCIAITISKVAKHQLDITAADVSKKALSVAKMNAKSHRAKLKFAHSNLFKNIKGEFDIIIANLPYVPVSDYKKFYQNLKHEPKLALTDGSDKFPLIDKFLSQAKQHLARRGVILIEVDPKFFKQRKDQQWRITKDLHSLNRFALMETKPQTKK